MKTKKLPEYKISKQLKGTLTSFLNIILQNGSTVVCVKSGCAFWSNPYQAIL